MNTDKKTMQLVNTAIMACLVLVATSFIKIPTPMTNGYVHLGDTMVFLAVLILGWKRGALAAAIGSGLADILGGYAAYAPWTIGAKAGMAIIAGLVISYAIKHMPEHIKTAMSCLGMILGGVFMVAAYYLAAVVLYGNPVAALSSIPWNIAQFAVGIILAILLSGTLCSTALVKNFEYVVFSNKHKICNEKNK